MKLLFALASVLAGVLAVNGFLFGDNLLQCTFSPAACSGHLATLNSVGTNVANCTEKEPYFSCLRSNGCSKGNTFYDSQSLAFKYQSCDKSGTEQLVFSGVLCVSMIVLSKIFTV